jgi:hypothetical protein
MAHETRLDQALEDVFEEVGVVSKKLDQRRKTPEEAHAEIRLAIEAAAQEAGTDADVILRAVELKFAGAANLPSLVFPLLADLKVSAAKKEVIAAVDEVSSEIKVLDKKMAKGKVDRAAASVELQRIVKEAAEESKQDAAEILAEIKSQFASLQSPVGAAIADLALDAVVITPEVKAAVADASPELDVLKKKMAKNKIDLERAAAELSGIV